MAAVNDGTSVPPSTTPARVQIRDVARLAGVSHQTVSRVLNDQPKVAPETRERVLEAIGQLNFRPSSVARALTTGRTRTLGVVTFAVTEFGPAAALQSISEAAEDAGYYLNTVILRAMDRGTVMRTVNRLTGQGIDGLITLAPRRSLLQALRGMPHSVPMVALDDSNDDSVGVIAPDEAGGARQATEHLLGLGHATVWHLAGPADWIAAQERERGWMASLLAAGARVNEPVRGDWTAASGYELGKQLASNPDVTAIFSANDQMALGLLLALREYGRRVPEDVSVVGFDSIPESAYLVPPLTSVRPDFDEIGRRCVALMLSLIESEPTAPPRALLATELIVRGSTAPPRQS